MHVEDKEKRITRKYLFLPDYDVIKKGQKKIIAFLDESEQKKILKKQFFFAFFFGRPIKNRRPMFLSSLVS